MTHAVASNPLPTAHPRSRPLGPTDVTFTTSATSAPCFRTHLAPHGSVWRHMASRVASLV
ncbi:hypothetical protein HMPREF1318_1578 [Actinomyces massiliensis F0489]|uniref:Uncharacterized protein n=1 Tax=Actinomyces massiliensis F0489 TaxID=1125718 RepID=J0NJL2_9ACTO|nr:hypothetical protein HMPREF1318_1578 [Actinomyces massiliensis F0489]